MRFGNALQNFLANHENIFLDPKQMQKIVDEYMRACRDKSGILYQEKLVEELGLSERVISKTLCVISFIKNYPHTSLIRGREYMEIFHSEKMKENKKSLGAIRLKMKRKESTI